VFIGAPAGDLYGGNQVKDDPVFTRHGDHVVCKVPVSFTQAALGAEIKIPTLEGTTTLKILSGTLPQGIPTIWSGHPHLHGSGRGDEMVQIEVQVPTKLYPGAGKSSLRKFAEISGEQVNDKKRGFFNAWPGLKEFNHREHREAQRKTKRKNDSFKVLRCLPVKTGIQGYSKTLRFVPNAFIGDNTLGMTPYRFLPFSVFPVPSVVKL